MFKMAKLFGSFLLWLIMAVVAAMFAVGKEVWKESDGKAVNVTLTLDASVEGNQLAVIEGWIGITGSAGVSGDTIALDVSSVERQFEVPTALAVVKGETVYITIADLTGYTPDNTAYTKTAGAGKIALFKATSDQDDDDIVTGIAFPSQ